MNRRRVGVALMVAGVASLVAGVVLLVAGGDGATEAERVAASPVDEPEPTTAGTGSPSSLATTTTAAPTTEPPPTSSTATPATATPATTTPATTSPATTSPATTTSTTAAPPSIEDFVDTYARWIADGDVTALMATLLPEARTGFGEELCRSWVEREILELGDYRLTGAASAPRARTLSIDGDAVAVAGYVEAPVAFEFGGQSFESVATFDVRGSEVAWIGECR